ncbi:glutamate-rich protein 3 [Solea solea]|uniref:glutamate-rich protein 3 n=1 Tax=Solea solea TaxID=90069 RepID=UPI00272B53F2|nr:glutamate-rich protein 3 [Solea solea]
MNHLNPGLLSIYNSLTDKHLAGYFSNTRIRRHLQRAGLITRSGRIVPDKEYRHKVIHRAHQRHVRECLAQAIFHKVLEMERLHQIEIKRKLEEFARRERVHKIKLERSRRYEEDIIRILSPRPPTGARGVRKQHSGPEGDHSESSESLGSSRPNTAPGKMQRPVRLKPIHSNSTTATLRRSSPYRLLRSANDNEQLFNGTESRRCLTTKETSNGVSPYCLPVINNFVTPVPPATKRKERAVKVTPSGTLRGRRLRPTTATSVADVNEDRPMLRISVQQSRVSVNMVYFGKTVHLSHDMIDMRDEVKVFQQHCGGENLCVYKGKLREGESFQFISRRHRGFPFSLTFFLNGLQVERLSSCCEFKHRKGSRLGGRHGHFGLFSVEGASPCYKCIIAMGLDKKPTPPPKRAKEEGGSEVSVSSPKEAAEMETERTGEEDTSSHSDCETRQGLVKATAEDKARDDYEEDFEADDEGPVEDEQEKIPLSASSDTESQVKDRDTSETQDDEKDEDIKSRSGSSCSGSDQEVSDAEDAEDSKKDEKAELHREDNQELKLNPEEAAAATEGESGLARDSDLQHSAGDSTEINVSDTSVPSGQEHRQNDDTSEGKEAESRGEEGKRDEEEQERDNFVQEKITEAILNESQKSCEPQLTDAGTEEEEEATDKGHEQDNDEKSVTFEKQKQTLAEETQSEENANVGEAEVVQVQEDTSEPKKEDSVTEKELHENSDDAKDETVTKEEEDEKPASEDVEEKDKSEDMGAATQPVAAENTIEEPKTTEPREDGGAECTDTTTAPKDEEREEKSAEAVEADTQPQETGQGAETGDADVSSVSEPVKNTDEKAVSDNAEEEVMTARKTVEMKAEPSEEQEAISCEEAPVTDTEEKQQRDSTDTPAASQTGESVVENTAGIREDSAKGEASRDDIRETEEEAAEAGNGGSRQQEAEEEQKSVDINSVIERETCEEESKEEEKQTESDELAQGENSDGKENNETDIKEEKGNDECKAEEKVENEENMVEDTKSDKAAEKSAEEEDDVAHEEKDNESEKTERDKFGESDENKNEDEESRAKEATADQTHEGDEMTETKAQLNEEKEEKDDNGHKAEQSEQDDKEPEGENITTCKSEEGEGTSEITEEPEKSTDHVKTADENTAQSEDVGDNEATAGEMSDNVVESDDTKKDTEGASTKSEKGDVNAENGEMSNRGERESHDDETEASDEVKTAEHVEDEGKSEQVPNEERSTEVKEESHDDGDGDECGEKQESELEITGTEKTNTDLNTENRESHSTRNNDNMSDMIVASSADQAQSSTPTALGSPALKLDEFTAISDKNPHTDENTSGGNISAADGENGGDMEEVSKASEEGASVLLKPQAANNEADVAEQSVTVATETPEELANEDKTDLVTNWINMHQESKFFKKFVEPFDELRDDTSHAPVSSSSKEETTPAEQQRLESPLKNEQTEKSQSEDREKNNVEDLEGDQSDDKPHENNQDKNSLLEKEETEVKDLLIQKTGSEDSDEDSTKTERKGSKGSVGEDKMDDEENKVQDEPRQSDIFKTEVESIAGTLHSVASGKPKSEEKTIYHDPGTKSPSPASKTEEHHERSVSPDGAKDTEETWGKTDEPSGEVTEITDFTTSKSDDGSQEESRGGGTQPRRSDGTVNKELIQDIKHTLSKDRLSSFSVDETLFGHSSYPLLNAARTESLH